MGKTSIEWTDRTWNPVRGCSRVSEGCRNCYAEKVAARFSDYGQPFHLYADRNKSGSKWTGKVDLFDNKLMEPFTWRKPCKVFVNSMSDLFHEGLPDEAIDKVFAVMSLCPRLTFQCLTKRPERMLEWSRGKDERRRDSVADQAQAIQADWGFPAWPLPNVWLGVSVEDRAHKDRIELLRATPAAVRFLSIEPLLEDIGQLDLTGIHQVIIGGESGPGARPFDLGWARSVIAQCRDAEVACFFKQAGARPYYEGAHRQNAVHEGRGAHRERVYLHLEDRKGGDISEWPEDLKIRQFPGEAVACA